MLRHQHKSTRTLVLRMPRHTVPMPQNNSHSKQDIPRRDFSKQPPILPTRL